MRVGEKRYRVADIAVFVGEPAEDVPTSPPLVAIEILSPDDRFGEVLAKLEEYRAWGVAHVWFVDPISRRIYVYTAGLREVLFRFSWKWRRRSPIKLMEREAAQTGQIASRRQSRHRRRSSVHVHDQPG